MWRATQPPGTSKIWPKGFPRQDIRGERMTKSRGVEEGAPMGEEATRRAFIEEEAARGGSRRRAVHRRA
jgi:hypothetical protein